MTSTTQSVRDMFEKLVPEYDRFNQLSSLGLDTRWRDRVVRVFNQGSRVLDVGTGTGDLALGLVKQGANVSALDVSPEMIRAAQKKLESYSGVRFEVGSASRLPFDDQSFDGLVSAFVLRNLKQAEILESSVREFHRVLRPGGTMIHLELTRPDEGLLRLGHHAYLTVALPVIGRFVFGGRWPKGYLRDTIGRFPPSPAVCDLFRKSGLTDVRHVSLSGGIAGLFKGTRCSI